MTSATPSENNTGPTCRNTETSENSRWSQCPVMVEELKNKGKNEESTTGGMTSRFPMSSVGDRHARTLVALGSAPVLPVNAQVCSSSICESLGSFAPDGSFGKTSGELFPLTEDEIFSGCSAPFMLSGIMRNGVISTHPTLAIPTGGDGSSSSRIWPTPNVCSDNGQRGSGQNPEKRRAQGHQVTLQDEACHWPTPRGEDSESAGNHPGAVDSLTGATRHWITPTQGNTTRANNGHGPTLQDQAHWLPRPA
jgi:hypothetical protein